MDYWQKIRWEEQLARMNEPEFRKWFAETLKNRGNSRETEDKAYNPHYAQRSREAEIKVMGWMKKNGWQVTDVADRKWGYDFIARKKHEERKIDVVRREYWPDGFHTWPRRTYPPRLTHREIYPHSKRPATHYYITNDPMTRMLIVERAVILAFGDKKRIDTQSTKNEMMYHFEESLGIYENL